MEGYTILDFQTRSTWRTQQHEGLQTQDIKEDQGKTSKQGQFQEQFTEKISKMMKDE